MLGLVANYEWSLTPNGSYDCTLDLTGIGGVIKSLKMNGSDFTPNVSYITPLPRTKSILTTDIGIGAALSAA